MKLIKAYENKEKRGTYYTTAKSEQEKILSLCEQDLDKITTSRSKNEQHYLIPNYSDCVKVGITLTNISEVEFWAEVKSDVPYFGDKSVTITIEDFIDDLKNNTFTELTDFLILLIQTEGQKCDNCGKEVARLNYMGKDNNKDYYFCTICKRNTPTIES